MKKETSIQHVEREVHLIKEQLVERIPSHFNAKHVVSAFFGALLIGITFMPKGFLLDIATNLEARHLASIAVITLLILSGEIYFIGYERVKDKKTRPFFQFLVKRILSYYSIAFLVSGLLVYVYGVDQLVFSNYDVFRVIVAMSLPSAIGASLSDLLNQY